MTRALLLGLVGLALALAVGFAVHIVTRETISLPVAKLEQAPALAPPEARRRSEATTAATTTVDKQTTTSLTFAPATTDDGSGRGRGRGRGGRSGPGGGGDDD